MVNIRLQSQQGSTMNGLEDRCKALESLLDETTQKNQSLKDRVKFIDNDQTILTA